MKEKKVIDYTIEADKKTQIDDLTRWILFYKRTPKENKCQSL